MCNEDKPKVNQNEHNTETVNAGDNQKEMTPKDDCGEETTEEINFSYLQQRMKARQKVTFQDHNVNCH